MGNADVFPVLSYSIYINFTIYPKLVEIKPQKHTEFCDVAVAS